METPELPPGMQAVIEECPICGEPLENFFLDNDNNLVYLENYFLTPCYCTDIGLFSIEHDDTCEIPFVDHVNFHHTHE